MKKIKKLLIDNNLTISVAESLTSGMLQSKMAKLSGSSSFYVGGLTAYNIKQKVEHLHVDEQLAASCNCVSPKVAKQMARGVAYAFGSDVGIATTGYAEPHHLIGVGIPHAYIAIYCKGINFSSKITGTIDMTRTQMRTHVTNELIKEIPKFIEHVIKSRNKTVQEMIDSGEMVLKPRETEIALSGNLLNTKATFLRYDEEQGYIFEDSFGELKIFKSLDDQYIGHTREISK